MSASLALSIILGSFGIVGFAAWNLRDAVTWLRAWLYVRSFIKYDMPGLGLGAKVREGMR
jgi:hypothetical protein